MSDMEKYGLSFTALSNEERKEWEAIIEWCCFSDDAEAPDYRGLDNRSAHVLGQIAGACLSKDWDRLCLIANCNAEIIHKNEDNALFQRVLRRSYECAVADGHAGACCNLANMYHDTSNQAPAEDYALAEALYMLGADGGDDQASVNLGYIYYYGRGQEVDYAKAYECYARAALSTGNPEGFWKLGDMYAKGQGVRQSDIQAWRMYQMAYENGKGTPFVCRAAHHVADYYLRGVEGVVEADPERALEFYVEAELSYYKAIDAGLIYYWRCLEQAIEGQSRAREMIARKRAF